METRSEDLPDYNLHSQRRVHPNPDETMKSRRGRIRVLQQTGRRRSQAVPLGKTFIRRNRAKLRCR